MCGALTRSAGDMQGRVRASDQPPALVGGTRVSAAPGRVDIDSAAGMLREWK